MERNLSSVIELGKKNPNPDAFDEFKKVAADLIAGRVDYATASPAVQVLCQERIGILSGFKDYYKCSLSIEYARSTRPSPEESSHRNEESQAKAMKFALQFVNRVRIAFRDNWKYKLFLHLVNSFRDHGDIYRVRREVSYSLEDYPELDVEFSSFLDDFLETEHGKRNWEENELLDCEAELHDLEESYNDLDSIKGIVDRIHILSHDLPNEKHYSDPDLERIRELYGDEKFKSVESNLIKDPIGTTRVMGVRLNEKFGELEERKAEVSRKRVKVLKEMREKRRRQGTRSSPYECT